MVTYDKQEWSDELDNFTPLSPDRMNHMEAGIKAACDGWDSVSQRVDRLTPVVLFSNPSQAINTSVTLSSSLASYEYVDIEYKDNDGICGSVRASAPNGKSVCLMTAVVSSDSGFWLKSRVVKLSGTSITTDKSSSGYTKVGQRNVSGTGAHVHTDCIAVTRVVGYS